MNLSEHLINLVVKVSFIISSPVYPNLSHERLKNAKSFVPRMSSCRKKRTMSKRNVHGLKAIKTSPGYKLLFALHGYAVIMGISLELYQQSSCIVRQACTQ